MTDMSSANAPLLSIEHVSKAYDTTQALDDVTIDIRPNEFFALLGPSGCGKTTALCLMMRLFDP